MKVFIICKAQAQKKRSKLLAAAKCLSPADLMAVADIEPLNSRAATVV
jgi:hypothetical protein